MFAFRIIEHFDVVEDIRSRVFSGFVCPAPNSLAFEQVEEALCHRIVMAVPATAHTVFQIVMVEKRRPINACEL